MVYPDVPIKRISAGVNLFSSILLFYDSLPEVNDGVAGVV
jgi:hypothetical protein